jgi:dihydroorotate dehydrogenase electron transfer subunit
MTSSKTTRGTFAAEVLANEAICDEHYRLILDVSDFPPTAPGQFVQLLCRPVDADHAPHVMDWAEGEVPTLTGGEWTETQPLLRRPLSLAGRREHAGGKVELDIIYRVVGRGTAWLATATPGMAMSVLGPLGNAFEITDKPVAALVGGGVGIPPMLYLASALQAAGKQTVAFVGARTAALLPLRLLPQAVIDPAGAPSHCVAEFAACDVDAAIATDDGSLGLRGFVSESLDRWFDTSGVSPSDVAVYTCGPEPMMQAIAQIAARRGSFCQVSLERAMACGMGTCQSCICKTKADNEAGWQYQLCCADGPVFNGQDVIW